MRRLLVILGSLAALVVVLPAPVADAAPLQTSSVARATLDDTTPQQGQVVHVTGSGWKAGTKVKITLHPGKQQSTATAAADGTVAGGLAMPGDAPTAPYGITVEGFGADNLYAYLQNNITISSPRPAATLSDTSLTQGQVVTISGTNWKPGKAVEITLHPTKKQVKVTAGADRRISGSLTIPGDAVSAKYGITVAGTGSDGLYAYLENEVTITSPRPVASLDDTTLAQGQVVNISGEFWRPGTEIQLTLHPSKHQRKVQAGPDGRFSGQLDIPEDIPTSKNGITVAGMGNDGYYAYLENEVIVGTLAASQKAKTATPFTPKETIPVDLSDTGPVPRETVPTIAPRFGSGAKETNDSNLPLILLVLFLVVMLVTVAIVVSGRPHLRRALERQRRRLPWVSH